MDSHDDDLNLSDVVQPRTEAERLELEEAVARYRAERAEATERDNVRYLPSARLPSSELVPDEAVEGELLSPQESAELDRRRVAVERVKQLGQASVTHAGQVVHWVREAEHPVAKGVARNSIYVLLGAQVVGKRVWEAKTNSRYERMMRAAEAAGDLDRLADWEYRSENAKDRRHKRLMDWVNTPLKWIKAVGVLLLGVLGVLLGLGVLLALANGDPGLVMAPTTWVLALIAWVTMIVTLAWAFIVVGVPVAVVFWLWHQGKNAGKTPGWLQRLDSSANGDGGIIVTADGIVRALQNLGIPALNKAFKDGWQPNFELPPVRDGNGYRVIFDLPMGVTAGMIADKRPVLARNLHRSEVEVWPSDYGRTEGGKAGYVDVWVADSGTLSKPAPEYPLLHAGIADVFAGVPLGVSQRGDDMAVPLVGNDYVVGGMTGQGKSNIVRAIMLGAALDPLAELWVFVFAANGDFTAYEPRLSRYKKGADDETVLVALEALRELYAETGRREGRLDEIGAKKMTRAIAEKYTDLRPIVVAFSEVHELFGHPEFGEEAAELAVKTMRRARKTGISLGFDTQSSRKDSIPPKIVELTKVNLCLAVKTWRSNDGFLGDGSFASGVRATELRANVDRGTCVATGLGEAMFEIIKSYFIEVDDDLGWDAATDVIARAVSDVAAGTKTVGNYIAPQIEAPRDLLEDLSEVLGSEPVRAAKVPALLQRLAPRWAPYQRMTGKSLVRELAALGVKVPSTDGRWPVDPVAVREALSRQATVDLDDEG